MTSGAHFIFCIFLILSTCHLQSCKVKNKNQDEVTFYYWKTKYKLSAFELEYLKTNQVKKIYLHCFDVVKENNVATPRGVLLWQDSAQNNMEYIPTVFIANEIFQDSDTNVLKPLADKIVNLCTQILASQKKTVSEIQIDCDWTRTTRDNYFYFLTYLKQKNLTLSHTLRLYQYKYRNEAGIAPTNYATLMCYNMGNMKNEKAENSILNQKDLNAYLRAGSDYPQVLNVALPIFNWTLLYSGHSFKGILYHNPDLNTRYWKPISDVQYLCTQNYFDLNCEHEFYKGDEIRIEKISSKELKDALLIIKKHIKNSKNEIIYFDLDSSHIHNTLY